jgi:glycine cleavage system H protein
MSLIPGELKYLASHEWVRVEEDGTTVTIGITDHAQDLLGDVVFVELPEMDAVIEAGEEAGVVESVKAASDIFAPIGGTVIEINEGLEDSPEMVNSDPYDDGWFFKLKISDPQELEGLLSADDYTEICEAEDH